MDAATGGDSYRFVDDDALYTAALEVARLLVRDQAAILIEVVSILVALRWGVQLHSRADLPNIDAAALDAHLAALDAAAERREASER